jgi:exonuclease III
VLVWNINGLNFGDKLFLHDTTAYLSRFDIIVLSETRSFVLPSDFLPAYTVFHAPASRPSCAGEGILVAIRKCMNVNVQHWVTDHSSLWVKLTSPQFQRPLFIACCYLPPTASHQLVEMPLSGRFAALQDHFTAASLLGDVLLAGDFNARVGTYPAPFPPRPFFPSPRGCTDHTVTSPGRSLVHLCDDSHAFLLTGRVLGDFSATPTFKARAGTSASRLDHVVVSQSCLPQVVSSAVDTSRYESDHHPLTVCLTHPCISGISPPSTGDPFPSLSWNPALRDLYVEALQSSSSLPSLLSPISNPSTLESAFATFDTIVLEASASAGMPLRFPRSGPPHKHAPFYDTECVTSKRLYRAAIRRKAPPAELHSLERNYHNLVRAKRRAYHRRRLHDLLDCQRHDPRRFWKRLRSSGDELPLSLQDPHVWTPYLTDLCNTYSPTTPVLPDEAYPHRYPTPCAPLNDPITEDEVRDGLTRLHNGRSSSTTGIIGELYRYARLTPIPETPPPPHILLPCLHHLLNSAFLLGHIPPAVNIATVTPVFKKGDPAVPANYRPIAVSCPILRLYANILNARLLCVTEERHLRAPTQAGFRPSLSTLHPLFVLQHLVDTYSRARQPLYCCFLDLKSAYDYVQRPLLWEILARLGIQGRMFTALKSLYAQSKLAVKVQGRVGPALLSLTGLKQGCPLSPTFFGIYIDGLYRYLEHHCPDIGPILADGSRIPTLQYADDVTLIATTPDGLQRLHNCAVQFFKAIGLLLSPAKTFVMSFPANCPSHPWTCDGLPVQRVPSAKYLGLVLDARWGVLSTCLSREQQMWGAWATLQRQFAGLDCGIALGLLSRVYAACVPPAASYGCELWGLRAVPRHGALGLAREKLASGHITILRQILGLRKNTPVHIVLLEANSAPLYHSWLFRTITFWNNLGGLDSASLFRRVALDSISQAIGGATNWASAFAAALTLLDYPLDLQPGTIQHVDLDLVRHLLGGQLTSVFTPSPDNICPRTCPSKGVISCTYARWFQRPLRRCSRPHLIHLTLPADIHRLFFRFRSGCSGLPIDTGRHTGVPRAQRLCVRCNSSTVCDEYHLVFECPYLQPLRDDFSALFTPDTTTMVQFMWQKDSYAVATYVARCLRRLNGPNS